MRGAVSVCMPAQYAQHCPKLDQTKALVSISTCSSVDN